MKLVGEFLDKFKSQAVKEIQKRTTLLNIIKKNINEDIPIENISIKNGLVTLNTKQIVKNQIFIKKDKILKEISKYFNDIKDIK